MEIVIKCDIVVLIGYFLDKFVKYYDMLCVYIEIQIDWLFVVMGIEQIDLLLIYCFDLLMDYYEIGVVFDDVVKSGKVCLVGVLNFCFWDWNLLQLVMINMLVMNQIEILFVEILLFINGDIVFY